MPSRPDGLLSHDWWDAWGGLVYILVMVAIVIGAWMLAAEDERPIRDRPGKVPAQLLEDCEPSVYYGARGGC